MSTPVPRICVLTNTFPPNQKALTPDVISDICGPVIFISPNMSSAHLTKNQLLYKLPYNIPSSWFKDNSIDKIIVLDQEVDPAFVRTAWGAKCANILFAGREHS